MDTLVESLQPYIEQLCELLPKLVVALVVFLGSLYLSGVAAGRLGRILDERRVDHEFKLLLSRLTKWSIVIIGLVIALGQVDFNISGFLAGLGIVGFTIGFALQDVSKNLVAGLLLLLQQPFDIGDAIEVGDYSGTVTDITIRATELRTFDGLQVLIPNGDVYVKAIKNYSKTDRRRLEVSVGVAYDSDLDLVTRIVETALASIPGVIVDEPAPKVVFKDFGDSSINLTAYFWIDLTRIGYFDGQDQSIKAIKSALEQAEIETPFPIRTILTAQPGEREV